MTVEQTDCRKCGRFRIVEVNRRTEAMCRRRSLGQVGKRWYLAAIEPDSRCPKMGEMEVTGG